MKESNAMSRYSKSMSDTMAEVRAKEEELLEVSPPGFKGTVKAMKKHKDIDNPYALAWHMKNKGDEAHYKSKDGKPEKKEKFKEDAETLGKIARMMDKEKARKKNQAARADQRDIVKKHKFANKNPNEEVDEANLPPHLAKFFDKKGNPKPEVAKRMANAAKAKKAVVKDVTPKGYGPKEDLDIDSLHTEALQQNDIIEEVEWKVKLRGLPMFYVPAKSAGEVRAMLRKQIKKPDDILSIERSTKAAKKKDFRDRVSGKERDS